VPLRRLAGRQHENLPAINRLEFWAGLKPGEFLRIVPPNSFDFRAALGKVNL
jgi:hypothetical protein